MSDSAIGAAPPPRPLYSRIAVAAPARAAKPLRVAMLVANPCVSDSRVIREAEALVRAGHKVTVVCRLDDDLPPCAVVNGVTYRRVAVNYQSLANIPAVAWLIAKARKSTIARTAFAVLFYVPRIVYLVVLRRPARRLGLMRGTGRWADNPLAHLAAAVARRAVAAARLAVNALRRLFGLAKRAARFALGPTVAYNAIRRGYLDPVLGCAPDVVHAHDLNTLPAAFAAARLCGARVVFDSHELATIEHRREAFHHRAYKRAVEKRLIGGTAGVITVSEGFADIFVRWYGVLRPVVLFNAPQFSTADSFERDVRADLGMPKGVPLAVYIGGINPRRALSQLVEALVHCPEIHLVKVGPHVERWETLMRSLAERHGVSARLHFLDPVAPEDVVHFCRTGDFAVVTRLLFSDQQQYSMPNKLFESVLAGLPVVCGDTAEIRRFVEKYRVGMTVDCFDPNALGLAMREMYGRRDEFRPDAETIARIVEEFGWPAQERKLVNLYESLSNNYGN